MSACRRPGWNERVFVGLGSKTSFLGPANHNIANNSSAWRVSVISTVGITVFHIYYFMSNIDNVSTAVEMFIPNILDQLIRIRLKAEWMECHLEICEWIYCGQRLIILCVCVFSSRLRDRLGTAVFLVTRQHGPTSSTERVHAHHSVPTIPWWTAGLSGRNRYWILSQ